MTKVRTIDLVIKKQSDMIMLLKYLIYTLQTLDGNIGSAKQIFEDKYNFHMLEKKVELGVSWLTKD